MSTGTNEPQHILILGASGASGLTFIKHHLSLPDSDASKPYLTLYIRTSARSKLASVLPSSSAPTNSDTPAPRIRIIEGALTDKAALLRALSADPTISFLKPTAVISLLGAYMSLYHFLTRTTPTPIADAFRSTIVPALRESGVRRVLVLSTPSAFPVPGEYESMSWGRWLLKLIPLIAIPQGAAEMKGIANAVIGVEGLEATVFRVPFLTDEEGPKEVEAGVIGQGFVDASSLARESMVRWLIKELDEKRWVGGAPLLCNP